MRAEQKRTNVRFAIIIEEPLVKCKPLFSQGKGIFMNGPVFGTGGIFGRTSVERRNKQRRAASLFDQLPFRFFLLLSAQFHCAFQETWPTYQPLNNVFVFLCFHSRGRSSLSSFYYRSLLCNSSFRNFRAVSRSICLLFLQQPELL